MKLIKSLILLFILSNINLRAQWDYLTPNEDITVTTSIINIYSGDKSLDDIILYSYRCELIQRGNNYCTNYKVYKNWIQSEVDQFRRKYGQFTKPIVFESHSVKKLSPPPVYY